MENRYNLEWGLAKGVYSITVRALTVILSILKPKIKSLHKSKLQDSVLVCLFELEKEIDPECRKKSWGQVIEKELVAFGMRHQKKKKKTQVV